MPWKRFGKCVFKTTKSGKKKEKEGCSDTVPMAKKYLKALYANADDISEHVEQYFDQILLSEARFKDVKAKYSQYMGIVDTGRDYLREKLGDKGVSKYMLYVMKETHRMMDEPETKLEVLEVGKDDIIDVMFDLINLVEKFEKNVSRLDQKDIYQLDASELEKLVDTLPKPMSKERKEKKLKAEKESVRLYDKNDILVVRPLTMHASIYYGMATRWCISAEKCENYFDEYTRHGKNFAMVILKNLQKEENEPFTKAALVFDRKGKFESLFDAGDDQYYNTSDLMVAIARNNKSTGQVLYNKLSEEDKQVIKDIFNDILRLATNEIQKNPTDVKGAVEKKVKTLAADYRKAFKHAKFDVAVMDDPNSEVGFNVRYSGGFQINVKVDKMPTHQQELTLEKKIKNSLQKLGILFGTDEIEITSLEENELLVVIRINDDVENSEQEFMYFLENLLKLDDFDRFNTITRKITDVIKTHGFIYSDIKYGKEKAASDKLAKIDATDGTDPVNEVNEYFEELLKTELDRRIEKMTIEEWLDPDIPAPWDEDYEDKK